jgi:predicted phage tail component-like protein
MSNLKVVTLNSVTSTAGVSALRIRRVDRDLLGERRDVRVPVPGRDGSWVFPEEPGNRTIVIHGWLAAESMAAKRTAIHDLAEWVNTAGEVALSVDDESDRFYYVTLDSWDVDTSQRYATVEIEFTASAYGMANSLSTETLSLSGTSPESGSFNVTDDLGAYPVVEITPTNGTITAFTLTVNGFVLSWSGTLLDDETLTISSLSFTVTEGVNGDTMLTGAFGAGALSMSEVSGEFPELVPGSNPWSLEWTGTATTITDEFTWRERFY